MTTDASRLRRQQGQVAEAVATRDRLRWRKAAELRGEAEALYGENPESALADQMMREADKLDADRGPESEESNHG